MKFFNVFIKYPKTTILTILLLTVFFGIFATRVTMTTDLKDFFPENHPQVETYHRIEEVFGSAEYIMVALKMENIFTPEGLSSVSEITDKLAGLSGVKNVRSLTTIDEIKASDLGLEVGPLIENLPTEAAEVQALRERVLADPMYGGVIISKDGTAALHIVEVDPKYDAVTLAKEVETLVKNWAGEGELYLTGTPVLNNVLANSMKGDLKVLFPLVMLIIAGILYLYFFNLRGVLLPFAVVLVSLIWTLGLMGMLGKQISPLNSVMPIILVSLGNAYGIYIISRQAEEQKRGADKKKAAMAALQSVGIAVVMAGLTTIAGFLSNVTSEITQMRQFGIFTAVGITVALLMSLVLVPALLTLLKEQKSSRDRTNLPEQSHRWMKRIAGGILAKPYVILAVTLGIIILALAGLPRLSTDSNFFNFFAEDSEPKKAYNLVKEKFVGSESVEIVIKADLQNPEILQAMDKFQNDLEATGLVGKPFSLANVIKRTNRVLNNDNPEFEKVPATGDEIAQYLLLLEMNDTEYLSKFTTFDYQEGRIQALIRNSSKEGTERLMQAIDESYARHFQGLDAEMTVTGIVVLMDTLADLIIKGQVNSLIFGLFAVFLVVLALLKSWEGSFLSVLLVTLVTIINFGLMGYLGIALDIVTVLISSIGVGVGIDYSIHIYSRYKEEKGKGQETKNALARAIETTGKSIICNAGAVVAGFIILLFSSFPPLRYFGSLVTTIMIAASLGALTFVPAVVLVREQLFKKAVKRVSESGATSK